MKIISIYSIMLVLEEVLGVFLKHVPGHQVKQTFNITFNGSCSCIKDKKPAQS